MPCSLRDTEEHKHAKGYEKSYNKEADSALFNLKVLKIKKTVL